MSVSAVILVLSLMAFPLNLRVSGCDKSCADKPVFSPSELVVKYGDPASATCSVCQHECLGNLYNIEHAVGEVEKKNETTLHWKTDSLTEWDPTISCFYNNASDYQCCTVLPITLYKPPDKVSFSFGNHTGPLMLDNLYNMRCTLENVAPFEKFQAVFYRGDNAFGQVWSSRKEEKKIVTKYLELELVPFERHNGVEFWCEAELRLDSEGQQRPPPVKSERTTAIVYYKPKFEAPYDSTWLFFTEGDKLELNCTSVGNPTPSYNWTLPSGSLSPTRSSVFTIKSISFEHEGKYACIVSNGVGTLKQEFTVEVKPNYIRYVIAGVLSFVALLVLIGVIVYCRCYSQNRTGRYNLLDVLRLRTRHSAVPATE